MKIERSEDISNLAGALSKAQAGIRGAAKDAVNPHFKSSYADLASIWEACRDSLTAQELAVSQIVSAEGANVTVSTVLMHSSGQWIGGDLTLTARDATPQAVGSAITYGRRYALASVVGVAPDDDDDGQTAQPKRQAQKKETKPGQIASDQFSRVGQLTSQLVKAGTWESAQSLQEAMRKLFNKSSRHDLTEAEADLLIAELERLLSPIRPHPDMPTAKEVFK